MPLNWAEIIEQTLWVVFGERAASPSVGTVPQNRTVSAQSEYNNVVGKNNCHLHLWMHLIFQYENFMQILKDISHCHEYSSASTRGKYLSH